MKSSFLLTTLAAVSLFCSCSKTDSPVTPEKTPEKTALKKKAVEFKLPDFTQTVGDLRTAAHGQAGTLKDSLGSYATYLHYFAYDSSGNEVSSITQYNANPGFGRLKDSLYPGTYTIVMLASQGWEPLVSANPHFPLSEAALDLYTGGLEWLYDTFFKKFTFTVNSADSTITTDLALDRVVGKLEVNVLDANPWDPNRPELTVEISPESARFSFATGSSAFLYPEDSVTRVCGRVNQTQFSQFVLNTESAFTVTVKHIDYDNGTTYVKTIHNVRCYKNRRTILTGNIFDATGANPEGGFRVNVNAAWDPNDENIDF